MRRLLWLCVWLTCITPNGAHALGWEVEANAGAAGLIGKGWDANEVGAAIALSAGPRFSYVSPRALFLVHQLRLRALQADEQIGQTLGFMVAPYVYPLAGRYAFEPYFAPTMGVAYTVARADAGRKVDLATRATLFGGVLGGLWMINERYAVGASVLINRFFVRKACLRVKNGLTACDVLEDGDTWLSSVFATFRMSFGHSHVGKRNEDGALRR